MTGAGPATIDRAARNLITAAAMVGEEPERAAGEDGRLVSQLLTASQTAQARQAASAGNAAALGRSLC